MKTRPINNHAVPVIGQGTWMIEQDDRPAALAALKRGIELGMTHIDTAEMYGNGEAEELVSEVIKGRREEIYLVSKVLPSNGSFEGTIRACEASLKRLGTDYLDLYLLHWRGAAPLEYTFQAFDALKEKGKIRAFGVSNFDVSDLEEAYGIAGDGLSCNQVLYHLEERRIENSVVPWCQEHGVSIVGYSPFGQGFFPQIGAGGGVLESIAEAHGATRHQVALAFLTRMNNTFAIPKSGRVEHVADNAGAGQLELTPQETAAIDEAFPVGPATSDLPIL